MADELQLTDTEREAALQLVQLSEGETSTTSAAASPTSSSSSWGGSVTFDRPEINNNSVAVDNVVGDNDGKERKIRKENTPDQKMKKRKEDDFDGEDDDEGEKGIRNLMKSKITKRYRSIIDIYKATRPLIR